MVGSSTQTSYHDIHAMLHNQYTGGVDAWSQQMRTANSCAASTCFVHVLQQIKLIELHVSCVSIVSSAHEDIFFISAIKVFSFDGYKQARDVI